MNTKKISRLGDHPDRDDINLTNQNCNKNVDSESIPKAPFINLPLDMIKFLKILRAREERVAAAREQAGDPQPWRSSY